MTLWRSQLTSFLMDAMFTSIVGIALLGMSMEA
jgi:hypothetical protein